ncbi:MAG TPA: alpha-amylase family glycosyl hydrolase [Gemmatimonadaceae bacterium]|nr:alpha-amylase family glycosyl hydrolase [Gemmatimonadaceae bacterium]
MTVAAAVQPVRARGGAIHVRHPSLYQINTRVWLHELGQAIGRRATLDDVWDATLDEIARDGFDWIWLLGVWQTGEAGRHVSRTQPEWQHEYRELLPDFTPDDVSGSPFAVREYVVAQEFGGPRALDGLRQRLAERDVRLMLDFVPNHTALDHPWAREHPEYYVQGSEADLAREPHNYRRVETRAGVRVLAHGRDPYFPGWPDTLQVNYRHPGLWEAMLGVLDGIAEQCDGVRCDMAMLVLPEVIRRTWGERTRPGDGDAPIDDSFWPVAIDHVRQRRSEFAFMAEAYWDLEWTLQQQGFDYTYDKSLYDRLRARDAGAVRGHLHADPEYQRRSARFLENHDEPRAAAVFPRDVHEAAAVVTFLLPGLRFVHEGERVGRRLRASNHLRRRAAEPADTALDAFYGRLFACMRRSEAREGEWRLLEARPAWDGNPTSDHFISFSWDTAGRRLLVAVNYGPTQGQCYVAWPWPDVEGHTVALRDLMTSGVRYDREGGDLLRRGLYLDMPAWGHHVFEVTTRGT